MENEKMTDISTIKNNIFPIAKKYGLRRVFLFGSYAKGTATEDSDIDLLIEKGRPLSLLKLSGLRQDAKETLGRDVDLVTTTGIEVDFREQIRGSEVLLYEEQG